MQASNLRRAREVAVASFKRLSSYSKTDWNFHDYPVFVRQQSDSTKDIAQRAPLPPFVAYIVNWNLTGTGETPAEARNDLEKNFRTAKQNRIAEGKPMPRPGVVVPIEFASDERIGRNRALSEDFIHRVLELEWAFISDESSLWDFHVDATNTLFQQRIRDLYNVDVADIDSGRVFEILDRIAANQSEQSGRAR
jgi:hypothetical protein